MILSYKILRGLPAVNADDFFSVSSSFHRGRIFKLFRIYRIDKRSYFLQKGSDDLRTVWLKHTLITLVV